MKDNKHREHWNDLNRVGKGSISPETYRKVQDKQQVTDYHRWLKNQIKLAAKVK